MIDATQKLFTPAQAGKLLVQLARSMIEQTLRSGERNVGFLANRLGKY